MEYLYDVRSVLHYLGMIGPEYVNPSYQEAAIYVGLRELYGVTDPVQEQRLNCIAYQTHIKLLGLASSDTEFLYRLRTHVDIPRNVSHIKLSVRGFTLTVEM